MKYNKSKQSEKDKSVCIRSVNWSDLWYINLLVADVMNYIIIYLTENETVHYNFTRYVSDKCSNPWYF